MGTNAAVPGRSAEQSPCPTPPELEPFLEGAAFPASRDELVALAEERGVPQTVREVLEAIAQTDFGSATEVRAAAAALSR